MVTLYANIDLPTDKGRNSMCMLTGEYKHQLDAKNRIRIPARLKKELGDEYYFVRGDNNCVYVFDKTELQIKLEAINQTKLSDLEKQKKIRAFTRTVVQVAEDGQGRVVLTPELREHLAFEKNEKDIIVIGVGKRAEIWAKSVYDKYFEDVDDDYNSVITGLDI